MSKFRSHSGVIYFEQHGARAKPTTLLLQDFGGQVVQWPPTLIDGLVAAGLRVVTFDSRDSGLSAGPDTAPPSLDTITAAQENPGALSAAYSVADLAQDAVDLLDHLGQAAAHVVGYSLGGIVAQHLAADHPERVLSLTCIASSPTVPDQWDHFAQSLAAADANGTVKRIITASNSLGGKHFDSSKLGQARFAQAAFERAYRPDGLLRQLAAVAADGDRTDMLRRVRAPALIIHGAEDKMFAPTHAEALAAAIPDAKLEIIDQLGHDLPEPLIPQIVELIGTHTAASQPLTEQA